MAPATGLPEVNLKQIQDIDLMQLYFMLFQYMKDEFVHRSDLEIILAQNSLLGMAAVTSTYTPAPVNGSAVFSAATNTVAQGKAKGYQAMIESGTLAREGMIAGLNAITSAGK